MANEEYTEIQDLTADQLKEKANNIFEKNKTLIGGSIALLFILIVGLYVYTTSYKIPREAAAQEELYKADNQLKRDSFTLALNGVEVPGQANNFIGYVGIIKEYGGTPAANLAHYSAGISTLKIGQPKLALEYLSNFSGEELLQTQAYTLMGDAASELGDFDAALGHYQTASNNTKNLSIALYAKHKAGRLLEYQKKNEEAKKVYQEIMDADKQIGEKLGADKDLVRLK
ncbi:MAG: Tetratricopeptide repeat protein [uncultured Aureispira sp.]|uniref:Tetratricopeptide repeat protein n=1 Tax=uncultured Aureispira sp. TaxID=1331704 RepID=A0A6S6ULY1_9BACT|nr:MAG: Tetratricopeptide repeat protein [uncultured Aureispira sp.]